MPRISASTGELLEPAPGCASGAWWTIATTPIATVPTTTMLVTTFSAAPASLMPRRFSQVARTSSTVT